MAKTLLRNNSQSPITLPPPYTGIIAPGDAVVINDTPSAVVAALRIVPELIAFLTVTQVSDSQPDDGFSKSQAAANIADALAELTEPLDLNGQRIVNLADPIAQQDAATKQYVDLHAGGGSGTVQQVNSGTGLTGGPITVTGTLAVDFGDGAGKVVEGTNTRLVSSAPNTAGGVVYDTGSAYSKTASGAVGEVLKVGAGGLPEWAADSTAPSGPAGGDLLGSTYPNPIIKAGAIDNAKVSATAAIATSKLSGPVTDIAGNGLAAFLNSGTKLARTYYVAVNGSDGPTADGSISAPFASVQKAHDVAATDYPGNEFVAIEVGPGTFSGSVNITRYNTLIQGAGHRAEMQATQLLGAVIVNPATATQKYNQLVGLAGMYINPGASTAAAVKATGAGLYSLIVNDCYMTTGNAAATANALFCDATHPTRPRIVINDSILSVQTAGPAIVQLDRGDVRMNNTQILQGSSIAVGSAGTGVVIANDATLWLNSSLVETQTTGPGISATGASSGIKLILTTASITTTYSGAADTSHGVVVTNSAGVAAFIWQSAFNVADTSAAVYAINGSAPAVVVYGDLSFQPGTNSAIASAITLTPMTEKHGAMNFPSLTASLPLKLDASKNVTTAAISLAGTEVTGTLTVGKGGTGISTTPPAGAVAYGNGSTLAYNTPGTSGQPLVSAGTGTPAFGALNLAGAGNVSGLLPAANQAAQTVGGDLSGTTNSATVTGLQGRPMAATAPTAGQVVSWTGSSWEPATVTAGGGGGGGGGGLTYYLNYTTAGNAPIPAVGDKELSLTFNMGGQVNTGAVTAPQSPAFATLAEFVTDIGQPGATTIAPGNWDIAAYMVGSGPNNTFFRARVFKWDGATLTELSTSPSDWVEILTTPSPSLFTASVYISQAVLTASDRIVIRLEIQRTTAAARTVTGYFNGNTPSHTHTTLGAPGGTGVVKVVDGIIQAPATLIVNADVDMAAAIDTAKLDGGGAGNTNKVLHGGAGAPTWSAVALGSDVSGQLPVGNGGTGLASGTAGGVLYFATAGTVASTGILTTNALMLGGGVLGPTTLGSLGTSTQFLKGNAAGAPTWDSISLATDITGTLPISHGGTNGTATPTAGAIAYGTGTAYDFSLAGSAGQVLTSGGIGAPTWVTTLGYAAGGTGNANAPTLHGVAYGDGTKIVYTPAGTPGQVLTVGVGGDLEWGSNSADPTGPASGDLSGNFPSPTVAKINGASISTPAGALVTGKVLQVTGLSTIDYAAVQLANANAVAGILPVDHGGTGISTTPANGALPYGNGSTYSLLANSVGDSGKYLKSNGVGSPSWSALTFSDVSGTLPISKGGTNGTATPTNGGVAYGTGTAYAFTAAGTEGQVLKFVSGFPVWADNTATPSGTASNDLSGSYPGPTVAKINGASVPVAGTTGQVLQVTGVNTLGYGAINLASAASVTGLLPKANQAEQDLSGDLSGTTGSSNNATVVKIQGNAVQSGALGLSDAGKALVWSGAAWNASTVSGGGGGSGGGGLTYFLNYTNAGAAPLPAAGAKELSLDFDDVTPSTNTGAVIVPQSSYLKLAQFVTPVGEPGATTIPPGIWEVGVYAKADVSDSAFVRAVLSKWDGTTLTTISTASNVQVTATSSAELTTVDFFVPSTVLASNERLVITLEGTRTVAGSRAITLYFEGNTVSHMHTTLGAPGGTGVVKVVAGVVQAPASLIVNADINAAAAITVTKLDGTTGGGTSNKVLHGGATPSWAAIDLVNDTTGTLTVGKGGTGITTTPALGTLLYGNGTNYSLLANAAGDSGKYLKSNGVAAPTWTTLSFNDLTGTLTTANGGTGQPSYTAGDMVYYASGTSLSKLAISATSGAILTSTGSAPAWSTSLLVTSGSVTVQKPLVLSQTPVETLVAATTIAAGGIATPYLQIQSTTGAITLTSKPTIRTSGVAVGTVITLVNIGSNTIILQDDTTYSGSAIQLGGVPSRALQQYMAINLVFDGTYWIETAVGGSGTVQTVTATAGNLITVAGTTTNPTVGISGLNAGGTSGGIPYFNSTSTMASSAALVANRLMIGGGAGAAPATLVNSGLSGQPLLSFGASAPDFGQLNVGSNQNVVGNLRVVNGGTGTGTLGLTANGVLVGNGTSAIQVTAEGATGTVLKGNTGLAPTFGAVNLATDVTNTLPVANGGTGVATTQANKVFAGPTTGPDAAPSFRALVAADIPTGIPASSITGIPYDVAGSVAGTPNPSSTIFYFKAVRACTVASSGHQGGAGTAPTGSSVQFTVNKTSSGITTSMGTFSIDTSGNFTSSFLTPTSLAIGDVVTVVTPAAVNAISDPYWTLVATVA